MTDHHLLAAIQVAQFKADGFVCMENVLSSAQCEALAQLAGPLSGAGERSLLQAPWCADVARLLREHLPEFIPADHVAVQCTLYEKTGQKNALVAVHQDLSIPVAKRFDHPWLGGWSEKEGTIFVQPPTSVLRQMVAVRLHLDDCLETDGPLRLVPGTHLLGRIEQPTAVELRRSLGETICVARAGDVLIMRPLALHSSSRSSGTSRRRVLHFVFGPPKLPFGLAWHEAV
ncbi:phytanoyl-CoA dioxygenase family protein [Silvimonas iriomotensis]|uniref:Phytanoyl-CoA dioxygenase (PhyH) n=1 Tax=Silvimonas iriomotensis TaxID=449662 RepID=A0ABQ2PER2_9NEIS|nr:phytanoyl-CoA dioxygenase family protein [Silvimonas iriomotensis]GGP23808.1 hypothetical protein GCM10010970_38080 [Silvimonas iriomotensis]